MPAVSVFDAESPITKEEGETIARLLQSRPEAMKLLGRGSCNEVHRLEMADGRTFIVKIPWRLRSACEEAQQVFYAHVNGILPGTCPSILGRLGPRNIQIESDMGSSASQIAHRAEGSKLVALLEPLLATPSPIPGFGRICRDGESWQGALPADAFSLERTLLSQVHQALCGVSDALPKASLDLLEAQGRACLAGLSEGGLRVSLISCDLQVPNLIFRESMGPAIIDAFPMLVIPEMLVASLIVEYACIYPHLHDSPAAQTRLRQISDFDFSAFRSGMVDAASTRYPNLESATFLALLFKLGEVSRCHSLFGDARFQQELAFHFGTRERAGELRLRMLELLEGFLEGDRGHRLALLR